MTTATAQIPGPAWATLWTRRALAELPADLTTATPAQVDEAIRTLQLDAAAVDAAMDRAVDAIRKALGHEPTRDYDRRSRRTEVEWPTSAADAVAAARALPADTASAVPMAGHYGNPATVGEAVAALDAQIATFAEITGRVADLDVEFDRRGGWSRYYRVNNSNGHVHKSTACRETYVTTAWNWPTQLSGADSAGVVAAAGELTCLTCFPEVRDSILAQRPIDAAAFETREQTADRQARETEAKAKLAAKIAKSLTLDGSVFTVQEPNYGGATTRTRELKTARAGELAYVEFAAKAQLSRYAGFAADAYRTGAEEILAALAAKRETTVDALRASFAKKVEAKRIAENW